MKRYIILLLTLCLFLWLLSVRIIDIRHSKTCPAPRTLPTISEQEANDFLKNWQEYVARGYDQKVSEDFSQNSLTPSEGLPFMVKIWFKDRCIDPQRFYFVAERLRIILKTLVAEQNFEKTQAPFKARIAKMNKKDRQRYQEFQDAQRASLNTEGVSRSELDIVRKRENEIRTLLR